MKRIYSMARWHLIVAAMLLLSACDLSSILGFDRPVNKVADRIDATIAALNQNSADWQRLVSDLVTDLKSMEQDIANQVQAIANRGIATAGVEFRCNADFIGNRVKEALQGLSAKLRGQTPPPLEPVVCQIAFSPPQTDQAHINMANVPDEVLFYGYNFDITSEHALEMVLEHSEGEMSLLPWVNRPTHYLLTLKTAPGDGVPMCNLKDRSITMRWGSKELYSLGVITYVCPGPPPAPTPFPLRLLPGMPQTDKAEGNFVGGFGEDRTYGGACSNGFQRSSYQAIVLNSTGGAEIWEPSWVDDNENNCTISVHYSIPHGTFARNFIEVKIFIYEKGKQLPPPPPPPCLCQ